MPDRPTAPRLLVKRLAAAADVDVRTATRALTLGVDALHGGRVREAILEGAATLGIELPLAAPPSRSSTA